MANQIPIVDYLVLGDEPHLVVNECSNCGARYFDRRNACARPSCGGLDFHRAPVSTEGEVTAFTIVKHSYAKDPGPFVAAIVDCAGTSVRANIVNVEPDPARIGVGTKVRLTTFPLGVDAAGTEAIGFGFEPERNGGHHDR